MKIEWSARSRNDLRELKKYIAQDSPYYARRFIARIIASVEKLADFPDVGREVPEAKNRDDARELIFQGYRIIYLRQVKRWGSFRHPNLPRSNYQNSRGFNG